MTATTYEAGTPDYRRQKAKESRDAWEMLGCSQVAITIPKEMAELYKGRSFIDRAARAVDEIMTGDIVVMETLAQRRPRVDVKFTEIDVLKGRRKDVDILCGVMEQVLREMRWHTTQGRDLQIDADTRIYHFATEWVLNSYLKGLHSVASYMLENEEQVSLEHSLIDIERLREGFPGAV